MRAFLLALVFLGCNGAAPPPDASSTPEGLSPRAMTTDSTRTLFDFDSGEGAPWRIVNDGVMGGKSQGFSEIRDGALRFTGTLVTDGGGFTSTRVDQRMDLSGYAAIELRVRGGGRSFELDVDDGTLRGFRPVSRRGAFPTSGDWQIVRVEFADLQTSVFGQPVRAEPLAPEAVRSLSLFIADGQDGPFELEVDWIRAAP
ncbi:CIA30 family protein [Rubricoccus marinus]|nr:CIA30 family protein [Rubricoccus marinus]